jgi:hypothetical protein
LYAEFAVEVLNVEICSRKGKMFAKDRSNEKAVLMLSLFNDLPSHYQDVVLGTIELLRKANETERKNKR